MLDVVILVKFSYSPKSPLSPCN